MGRRGELCRAGVVEPMSEREINIELISILANRHGVTTSQSVFRDVYLQPLIDATLFSTHAAFVFSEFV